MSKYIVSRQKRSAFVFLLKFFAFFAVLFTALYFAPISFLTDLIAWIEAILLSLVGLPVMQAGSLIVFNDFVFQIINECTGFVMLSMLAALLYATPTMGSKEKYKGFALFVLPLLLFNLLRLFLTLFIGISFGQSALDVTHFVLWIVDALVVFLVWMHLSKTSF